MQIRVICVCDLGILTGSRDKTIKLWVEGDDGEYTEASMFVSLQGLSEGHGSRLRRMTSYSV